MKIESTVRHVSKISTGALASALLLLLGACASMQGSPPVDPEYYKKVIASPVRTDNDRKADEGRKPLEFLQFLQVRPGQRTLDVVSGGGYTVQLVALAAGAEGSAYGLVQKPGPAMEKRMLEHPDGNFKLLVRTFDDPYPFDQPKLDLVTLIMNYHDIANTPLDRAVMNRKIFEALKPGGHYVVIDHSTKPGAGATQTKTLHRIEDATVKEEVTRAGFVLEATSDYLRNPADPREQGYFDMKGVPSDKWAMRFVKP